MHEEEAARITEYVRRLSELQGCLKVDQAKAQIAELERRMAAPGFWENQELVQKATAQLKTLKTTVEAPESLKRELDDVQALIDLAREEEDKGLEAEIAALVQALGEKLDRIEITSLLSDPRDAKNAIVNIHPGAGGTESCDWASMLYRMFVRFCERRDFSVEVVDILEGEEAGIKSATLTVSGPFAYGNLKSENGVHRLVRISPFDANRRRHTSFAAIEVLPEVDDDIQIEIREEDLKMDVFRSSGAGGQKVNKTSSAVRLTHTPTGIVVACQVERSQHRNRAMAMQLLRAKLYNIELRKQEAELAAEREGQQDVAWGSQIRNYVLQPYQLVKDLRTNVETSNVDRVLDGDLDMFIEAYLKWSLKKKG